MKMLILFCLVICFCGYKLTTSFQKRVDEQEDWTEVWQRAKRDIKVPDE